MVEVLYDLTIRPIWLLLEAVFKTAYSICNNPGISIIFVSLVVNFLVLPLYLRADAIQSDEHRKQKEMEPVIKHFKQAFSGDERFLVLSTYYRQNDYQPWYALKSSISLLLQIPFFTAAYRFLSDLQLLRGVSFLFIKDLGLPDATFTIGDFPVNLLPIAMTAINLVSSAIYTKGRLLREKVQTVVMALIFLVLLYNSPSGLVFYWTLNNLFSLGKNIVMNPVKGEQRIEKRDMDSATTGVWFTSSVLVSVLLGMLIPISVISESPSVFAKIGDFADPTRYVLTTTAIAAGFFIVWGGVAYFIGSTKFRNVFSVIMMILSVVLLVDYFIYTRNFGTISDTLSFSREYMYNFYEVVDNTVTIISVIVVLLALAHGLPRKYIVSALSILSLTAVATGVYRTAVTSYNVRSSEEYRSLTHVTDGTSPLMKLSRTGKNVVVLVMDRAINGLFPYIINEKPEIADSYSGFTYYPNTLSFSACTLQGAPALYGGYEYTTYEIGQRPDETLNEKVNEAIKLMPEVFSQNGYHSTLCSVPLGNLDEYTNLSIFEDIANCNAVDLRYRNYDEIITSDEKKSADPDRMVRNFFFYSLCRTFPLAIQSYIYDDGNYNAINPITVTNEFLRSYAIMKNLPELTQITDDDTGQLFIMHNYLCHEPAYLDPPDYMLKSVVDCYDTNGRSVTMDGRTMHIDNDKQLMHYDSNMTAHLFLSKWIDMLKEEGVYDNTRIIIVADHGYPLKYFDDMVYEDIDLDVEYINPLLMVKDFDSEGTLVTDEKLMTNADVPVIAMDNLITDPVNPYTGNPINSAEKEDGDLIVTSSNRWSVGWQYENAYDISDSHWYTVHDSIFNRNNWTIYEAFP